MTSKNPIVENAITAVNAGVRRGNYQVSIETVDFTGSKIQTKNMTDAQLKAWLGLIHASGIYAEAISRFAYGDKYYDFNLDMHPTIHIEPI